AGVVPARVDRAGAASRSARDLLGVELPRVGMTARWRTFLLFLALLVAKIVETVRAVGTSIDGGYYTDIAEHVRDGDGLVSDVSLYHAGVPSFPYPTPIYPLWPWLLGLLSRVVDVGIL